MSLRGVDELDRRGDRAGESVFHLLEPRLPSVSKPIQYVGGELNSTVKEWESVDVRWALMYPDAYEVGLPNQGVQILYEVLNERDGVLAERTYTVWPDLEALMREHGVPQFTVDSHRPVGAFDVLGLSFEGGDDHVSTVLEWGVRQLGKPVVVHAEGDLPAHAVADLFPAYDDDGGLLLVLTPSK